jgi:hypothetical protein
MEPICKINILPIKDDFVYHYDQNGCPLVRICPGQYVTSDDKKNKTLITCKCPNDMYLDLNKNDCVAKCEIIRSYFNKINATPPDIKINVSGK